MSGGTFDYQERHIKDIVEQLQDIIHKEESPNRPSKTRNHFFTCESKIGNSHLLWINIPREIHTKEEVLNYLENVHDVFKNDGKLYMAGYKICPQVYIYEMDDERYPDDDYYYDFSQSTLDSLKQTVDILNKAYIYIKRADYLLSGDDDEENYHKRLKEDLLN